MNAPLPNLKQTAVLLLLPKPRVERSWSQDEQQQILLTRLMKWLENKESKKDFPELTDDLVGSMLSSIKHGALKISFENAEGNEKNDRMRGHANAFELVGRKPRITLYISKAMRSGLQPRGTLDKDDCAMQALDLAAIYRGNRAAIGRYPVSDKPPMKVTFAHTAPWRFRIPGAALGQ